MDEVEVFRGAAVPGQRELIESILREEQIPYVVRSEGGIAEHPITIGPMGEFIVLVPAEHGTRARALLHEVDEAEPVDGWEEDEPTESATGLLSSARRRASPQTKRLYRWIGPALLVVGLVLVFQYPSGMTLLGALMLFMAALMLLEAFL